MTIGLRTETLKGFTMQIFQHDDDMMHFMNQLTFLIHIGNRGHWFNNAGGRLQENKNNVFEGVLVYEDLPVRTG
jgi:hypothetical protein